MVELTDSDNEEIVEEAYEVTAMVEGPHSDEIDDDEEDYRSLH